MPPTSKDLTNLLYLLSLSSNALEDNPSNDNHFSQDIFQKNIQAFFDHVTTTSLKTGNQGWILPRHLLPKKGKLKALVSFYPDKNIHHIIIPKTNKTDSLLKQLNNSEYQYTQETLLIQDGNLYLNQKSIPSTIPLIIEKNFLLKSTLQKKDLCKATKTYEIPFEINTPIQNITLKGSITYSNLEIGEATVNTTFTSTPQNTPVWIYHIDQNNKLITILPSDPNLGEGILLSQRFADSGVLIGDRGYISYNTSTTSAIQEQRIPIYVAGFFDSGVIPIGTRLALVNKELVQSIDPQEEGSNGISIWFDNTIDAKKIKNKLINNLKKSNIDKYWHVETYKEYDFSKNLVEQFQSDKNILTLIAMIIIIVACSNIITMLIILVNDKKKEIGILSSMGASSKSIGCIFGLCGLIMGTIGSAIGTISAIITLNNLDLLVSIITNLQGYEAFNTAFYGNKLPNTLNINALATVLTSTIFISLIAAIIPAIKATRLRPAAILRSE